MGAHKADEVRSTVDVNVSDADRNHESDALLSGQVSLVQGCSLIDQHSTPRRETWFSQGKDDPEAALLKIEVVQAEAWDAPSSSAIHLYSYVKVTLAGQSPYPGANQKLRLS